MKGLILAAGKGNRLRPLTDKCPKAMVEVQGIPLIIRIIENMMECGISEIGVVVGCLKESIISYIGSNWKGGSISYFNNEEYETANNMVSLCLAEEFFDDDIILSECDLVYSKEILYKVVNAKSECAILVSPFNSATMDGTVIRTEGKKAISLILGKWQEKSLDYSGDKKTVNVYKFSKNFIKDKLYPQMQFYLENGDRQSYYELAIGALIFWRKFDIEVVEVPEEEWCEIDNMDDLKRANEMKIW